MPLVAEDLCLSESTFCLVTQAQAGQSNCAEKLKIEMNRHTMTIIIKLNTLLKENVESWVKCKKKSMIHTLSKTHGFFIVAFVV